MNDIERTRLENYIEQKRKGLLKLIDGTFSGIRAMIPLPTVPTIPEDCQRIAAIELKTWPAYFQGLWDGTKCAEVRRADRPFVIGGLLLLREWKPLRGIHEEGRYTGNWVLARVTRLDELPIGPDAYVLLSLAFLSRGEGNLKTERHPCAVAPEVAPAMRDTTIAP